MSRWIDAEYCEDFFDRWESRVKDADPVTIDVVQNTRTLLREAPSIDIQQWIPCVEEMPKEFVYVLICLKDGAMYVAQLTDYIDIWGNPKWCTNTKHCLGGAILGSEVIAWKPLPEPYGEREGE